jgi:hypothetical protein
MSSAVDAAKKAVADHPGAAFLATSITVITAVLTGLGVTGTVIGRMARNQAIPTYFAFGFALAAVVLGAAIALLPAPWKTRAAGLGIFCVVVAGGCAIGAAVATWGEETKPHVAASLSRTEQGILLEIQAKMSGLEADERLHVSVWPVTAERALGSDYSYEVTGLPLHRSVNGPNADGDVDYSAKVPLPPQSPPRIVVQAATDVTSRPTDCLEEESRSGCVVLYVGDRGRPQISASRGATGAGGTLVKLQLTAENIPLGTLFVRAFGIGKRPTNRSGLANAQLAPGANGDVRSALEVVVPPSVRAVCVVASTLSVKTCPPSAKEPETHREACLSSFPPPKGPEDEKFCRQSWINFVRRSTSWVRLRVPASG